MSRSSDFRYSSTITNTSLVGEVPGLLAPRQTLQAIEPGGSSVGFGYGSPFDGVNVPFVAAFDNL